MAKTIAKTIGQDLSHWGLDDFIELKSQLDDVISDIDSDRSPKEIKRLVLFNSILSFRLFNELTKLVQTSNPSKS